MNKPRSEQVHRALASLLLGTSLLTGCNDLAKIGGDIKSDSAAPSHPASSCMAPEVWREITMGPSLGNAHALLYLQWRGDRLYYQFFIGATSAIRDAVEHPVHTQVSAGLTRFVTPELDIELLDMGGFKLTEIKLPVGNLVREMDDAGKPVDYFTANDSIECSREVYCSLWNWRLVWTWVGARL